MSLYYVFSIALGAMRVTTVLYDTVFVQEPVVLDVRHKHIKNSKKKVIII